MTLDRDTLEAAAQLCLEERDKADSRDPDPPGSTVNRDHLMGQACMANLLAKKLRSLSAQQEQNTNDLIASTDGLIHEPNTSEFAVSDASDTTFVTICGGTGQPCVDPFCKNCIVTSLRAELEAVKRQIAWLEEKSTLHTRVDILYVVDGYEVEVMHEDGVTSLSPQFHGATLGDAIDAAMKEPGHD